MFTRTNSKNTGKEICECGHVRNLHNPCGGCVGIIFNGHVDNRENCTCYGFKNNKRVYEEIRSWTSEELYQAREMEIKKNLKAIKSLLKDHKNRFSNDPKNYGYAGDLGSILNYLRNITEQF